MLKGRKEGEEAAVGGNLYPSLAENLWATPPANSHSGAGCDASSERMKSQMIEKLNCKVIYYQ